MEKIILLKRSFLLLHFIVINKRFGVLPNFFSYLQFKNYFAAETHKTYIIQIATIDRIASYKKLINVIKVANKL